MDAAHKPDPDENGYDEDQWHRSITETDLATSGEEVVANIAREPEPPQDTGPLPGLEKLLEKVPKTSQDMIDSLFRGKFTGVKRIDRKKLL